MDKITALRCARLSQDVYQDFAAIQFQDLPGIPPKLINIADTDTQMAILEDVTQDIGYIVFRGSTAEKDWQTNFDFDQQGYEWSKADQQAFKAEVADIKTAVIENQEKIYPSAYPPSSKPVKMHAGFISAYLSVRQTIHAAVQQSDISQWIITGHSLGGALATLCGLDIQYNFSPKVSVSVYTFGSPKVGNDAFVESYNRRVPDTWRYVYGRDIVTMLPRWWQGYQHVKTEVKLDTGGTWRLWQYLSGSIEDHRLTNYITRLAQK